MTKNNERNFSLDILRVLACVLVMWQHASEYYYIGEGGSLIVNNGTYIIGFINSLSRASVPLFIVISGYFLLPMKTTSKVFIQKRTARVIYPFLFWCIAYAIYYVFYRGDTFTDCLRHIVSIPINYGTEVGHLWYIYMLIGVYLLIPILSPWVNSCSKREMQIYLCLWLLSSTLPYIHLLFPEILGECSWNKSPLLYYFTGFAGYLLLGSYIKRYGLTSIFMSSIILIVGYLITAFVFIYQIPQVSTAIDVELSWEFCSINVVMMTYGIFALVHKIKWNGTSTIGHFITSASLASYAIYLAHIMILNMYHDLIGNSWYSVSIEIPTIALFTFFTTYAIVRLLALLPKAKYWLGV